MKIKSDFSEKVDILVNNINEELHTSNDKIL